MFEFDEEKAVKRFLIDFPDYPHDIALQCVRGRHNLHEKLRPAFLTWINDGVPEFEYEGFTLEGLKESLGQYSYYGAFNHMDMILKDSQAAIDINENYFKIRRSCQIF